MAVLGVHSQQTCRWSQITRRETVDSEQETCHEADDPLQTTTPRPPSWKSTPVTAQDASEVPDDGVMASAQGEIGLASGIVRASFFTLSTRF